MPQHVFGHSWPQSGSGDVAEVRTGHVIAHGRHDNMMAVPVAVRLNVTNVFGVHVRFCSASARAQVRARVPLHLHYKNAHVHRKH